MKFKDKRVDKMLSKKNLKIESIFYSPIKSWLLLYFIIIGLALQILLLAISLIFSYIELYTFGILLIIFGLQYILASMKSNSFALNSEDLFVINSNFPFRKIKSFKISEIKKIKLSSENIYSLFFIGIIEVNYIEIYFENNVYRFYCIGLELDDYEEGWIEKTMEDFQEILKEKEIKTEWLFD
ncbi:hypothetical protein [Aureivirga marina]|uniref:hypothetical protein n=1 Tax=Aureivirga marina TaxID=1182451 RepID=UPI0018CB0856|nr:hypothetical protein [Aureivirga marina]